VGPKNTPTSRTLTVNYFDLRYAKRKTRRAERRQCRRSDARTPLGGFPSRGR
jgi:hypothetical protein